ncbi:MAG: hypothetical protein ACI9NT_000030 [Bacteroidia bacterium]|jgi:hypothetical protein
MRLLKTAFVALALVSAPVIAQDCSGPEVPAIPDGATSTYNQMIEGMGAVNSFKAANIEYMKCLDALSDAAKAPAKEGNVLDDAKAELSALDAKYNDAVSNEERLAGQFNAEIRAYKETNPE